MTYDENIFLQGVKGQFDKPLVFDGAALLETMKKEEQIRTNTNLREAQKAADKKHLEDIAKGALYTRNEIGQGFNKDPQGTNIFMEHIKLQMRGSLQREAQFERMPREKSKQIKDLEELYEIDYSQLIEAKADRTKASILEDTKAVEDLDKEVKTIEGRLEQYTNQLNELRRAADEPSQEKVST